VRACVRLCHTNSRHLLRRRRWCCWCFDSSSSSDEPDILDESIAFFRANVLFRTFQSQGPADLTLAYFTAFIAEVLRFFAKQKTKEEARKKLTELSMSQNFPIPGDKNFALAGFFSQPSARAESDAFRTYFRQAREEVCTRLIEVAYDATGAQNKWWISFAKRKFMNITSISV
jgi:actin related protein 2/3 complex subunit 3